MNPAEDGPKRAVRGRLVKVLTHRRGDRGMTLEPFASRCVRRGDVHELITTDHTETGAGARIDRVGFLGFVEIDCAGVLDRGDELWADGRLVGTLLGFDACHFPNHYNLLVTTARPVTGPELRLAPGSRVLFEQGVRRPAAPGTTSPKTGADPADPRAAGDARVTAEAPRAVHGDRAAARPAAEPTR